MTVVINMHKTSFIFKTCVMSVLCTPLQVKCYHLLHTIVLSIVLLYLNVLFADKIIKRKRPNVLVT